VTVLSTLQGAIGQQGGTVRMSCGTSIAGRFLDVHKQGDQSVPDTAWPLVREVFKVSK
jgi:hypothetical protein